MTPLTWQEKRDKITEKYPRAWAEHVDNTLAAIFYCVIRLPRGEISKHCYSEPLAWEDAYTKEFPSVPVAAQEGEPQDEQKLFERWVRRVRPDLSLRWAFVGYADPYTRDAFAAWQARASLEFSPVAALPVEGADFELQATRKALQLAIIDLGGAHQSARNCTVSGLTERFMNMGYAEIKAMPASKPEPSTPDPQNVCARCGKSRRAHWTHNSHTLNPSVGEFCWKDGYHQFTVAEASTIPVAPKEEILCANCGKPLSVVEIPHGMGTPQEIRLTYPSVSHKDGSLYCDLHNPDDEREACLPVSVPSVAASPQEGTRFDELYERSKRDDAIIVGSEVREVIGAYRRAMDGAEYWKKRGLFICGQNSTGIKQGCGKEISSDEMYRCADCKLPFCKQCVTSHFTDEHKNLRETMEAQSLALAAAKDENQQLWNLAKRLRDFIEFSPLCSTKATDIVIEADAALEGR